MIVSDKAIDYATNLSQVRQFEKELENEGNTK